MFLDPQELNTVIYEYQLQQIVESNNTIVATAILAAELEVKSYLTPSNLPLRSKTVPKYDTKHIFEAVGQDRNPLILLHVKNVAVWHLITLSNADIIFEHVRQRYDRSIDYLKKIASGELTLNLPLLAPEEENPDLNQFHFGSNKKFNHE